MQQQDYCDFKQTIIIIIIIRKEGRKEPCSSVGLAAEI